MSLPPVVLDRPGLVPVIACTPLLSGVPLSESEARRLAAAMRVLADPARLRLLSLIAGQPGGEACVCHLTTAFDLAQPTVSHHLKVLHQAGILGRERRGSWVYYRVEHGALDGLLAALGGAPSARASSVEGCGPSTGRQRGVGERGR